MPTSVDYLTVEPIARLIEELGKLPGIGPKTTSRLTCCILRANNKQAPAIALAMAVEKK